MAAFALTRDVVGDSSDLAPARLSARAPTDGERRLAARLARGDQSALGEIQTEYSGVLRGYLQRALQDRAAAEDVFQQVMVEVWQRGASFDPERGSMLSWLMAIARSRMIDHVRRRVPEPQDPGETTRLIDLRGSASDAEGDLASQWQMAHLLTQIPREEARILWLRFHRDYSQREISAEMGIALGTVKMRMVTGLARLRELMEGER